MQTSLKVLSKVAERYAPSRILSFGEVHVFATLILLRHNVKISRGLLCRELGLGQGAAKTLMKHLKMHNLTITSNGGTTLSDKGQAISDTLTRIVSAGTPVPKCSVALGKHNYAILLKGIGYTIKTGIEQRDAVIKIGGSGATTLLYKEKRFVMPGDINGSDSLHKDLAVRKLLIEKLHPGEGDAVIIASGDTDSLSRIAANNACLLTLVDHEKHF